MARNYRNYSDDDVRRAASQVYSLAGMLNNLGLKPAGGNYANMRRLLQKLEVDTSHWTGQGWSKDLQKKDWADYTRVGHLKPHLIKLRGHSCEECKLEEWGGGKIPLEVHHEDGDRTNNNESNLKLLCPNCHAVTDNWRGRKSHQTQKE